MEMIEKNFKVGLNDEPENIKSEISVEKCGSKELFQKTYLENWDKVDKGKTEK